MLCCMRTTIEINDDLMRQVKRVALQSNRTLRAVIEDALRCDLAKGPPAAGSAPKERVITFKGRGLRPGIDLDNTADLLDLMDGLR